MPVVISVLLVAAGAVLVWGLDASAGGVDVSTIGVILLAVGAAVFVASFLLSGTSPRRRAAEPPRRMQPAPVERLEEDAWERPPQAPEDWR